MSDEIRPGVAVTVRTALGNYVTKRALSGVEPGHDFLVVWVCSDAEWDAASAEGRQPAGTPWPAEDVQVAALAGA